MKTMIALICGLVFGAGLALSGMTNTQKVIGFLDVFGAWDFTLALVMAGGLLVTIPVYQKYMNRSRPVFDVRFFLPERSEIDVPLLSGALLFGVGWGLYGYCPGPAISSLAYGYVEAFYFVSAMVLGMFLASQFTKSKVYQYADD